MYIITKQMNNKVYVLFITINEFRLLIMNVIKYDNNLICSILK